MFRFFERFVDPYESYVPSDTPPQKLLSFLWSFAGPIKRVLFYAAILSVVVAAVEVLTLNFLGQLIDLLANTPRDQVWASHGGWLVGLALFLLFVRPLFQWLHTGTIFVGMLGFIATVVRWRSHRHVMRQSIGWFEDDFAGRIANRVTQTPGAVEEVASMTIEALAYAAAYTAGAFVLLGAADPWLMLPLAIWLVAYLSLLRWSVRHITPASEAHSAARSKFTGRIVDGYTNIHSVKMFAHHDREESYVKDAIEEVKQAQLREMRIFAWMETGLITLNGLLIVGVIGWAIVLWTNGSASVGIVAASSALVLRLNAMCGWIMWAVTHLFQNLGVVKEGMETIAQPITLLDASKAKPLQVPHGRIDVQEVSHHYGRGSGGLDRISLTIEPGEKVGLVGRSGAGKSTLVKLLLRFYDVESGRILIDDQDVAHVTQDSLRAAIGMVQQDNALLHRSIADNLTFGRPDATKAEMIAAAQKAQADEFIQTLTDKDGNPAYEAQVGERGVKLSGGQRQRIALARVILKDAPILVLDEATSALDSEVEAAIQGTLTQMMQGKTVIAIAHRLSTIAQMDRIVVLDAGRVVEDGTHDELLAQGGIYAGLWARQSGGFLEHEAAE